MNQTTDQEKYLYIFSSTSLKCHLKIKLKIKKKLPWFLTHNTENSIYTLSWLAQASSVSLALKK